MIIPPPLSDIPFLYKLKQEGLRENFWSCPTDIKTKCFARLILSITFVATNPK